jgi:hypothetical protein
MATINVLDSVGATVALEKPLTPGRAAASASRPVVLSNEDIALLPPNYTEDAAAAADPVGNVQILVRKDTLASEVSTDGDNVAQRGTSKGEAYTHDTDVLAAISATNTQLPASLGSKSVALSLATSVKSGGNEYETVAASQTTQTIGATGAVGDYLEGLLCVVSTAATSQVQIKDGSDAAITVLPNAVGGGIGTYPVPIGLTSRTGAWQVTTAAGVSVIALGDFT